MFTVGIFVSHRRSKNQGNTKNISRTEAGRYSRNFLRTQYVVIKKNLFRITHWYIFHTIRVISFAFVIPDWFFWLWYSVVESVSNNITSVRVRFVYVQNAFFSNFTTLRTTLRRQSVMIRFLSNSKSFTVAVIKLGPYSSTWNIILRRRFIRSFDIFYRRSRCTQAIFLATNK